jgi:hypothetical protein
VVIAGSKKALFSPYFSLLEEHSNLKRFREPMMRGPDGVEKSSPDFGTWLFGGLLCISC